METLGYNIACFKTSKSKKNEKIGKEYKVVTKFSFLRSIFFTICDNKYPFYKQMLFNW